MYSSNSNLGGWPGCTIRTYLDLYILKALPIVLKNAIIDTKVISSHGKEGKGTYDLNYNYESTDKMYLLSSEEVYSDWNYSYDSAKGTSRQLDYYNNLEVSTSNYSGAIKYLNGTEYRWWLRGANGGSTYAFFDVQANGNYGTTNAPIYDYAGFSPTFRLAM